MKFPRIVKERGVCYDGTGLFMVPDGCEMYVVTAGLLAVPNGYEMYVIMGPVCERCSVALKCDKSGGNVFQRSSHDRDEKCCDIFSLVRLLTSLFDSSDSL